MEKYDPFDGDEIPELIRPRKNLIKGAKSHDVQNMIMKEDYIPNNGKYLVECIDDSTYSIDCRFQLSIKEI